MASQTLLALLFLAIAHPAFTKYLDGLVPLCDENSPQVNQCIKDSANKLIPQLRKGIREINLTPLDPLKIARMDIGQADGAVYLKLELSDTVHRGLGDTQVEKVVMDKSKNIWSFDLFIPRYTLIGNYVGKGKILVLPLGGEGLANFTFNDVRLHLDIHGAKKVVNGEEYFDVKDAKATFNFTPGKNYLDINRLKGDLTLADHTRKFLSENADEVFNGLKGTLGEVYSDIITGYLRRVFDKVPYKKLFKH